MALSSWLVGSYVNLPAMAITVTANASAEVLSVPAGTYYVDDPNASLSYVKTVASVIATHVELSTCVGYLGANRKAQLVANAPFTMSFGASLIGRGFLGCTGNLSVLTAAQEAQGISPYLWVPGRPETSSERFGTQGREVFDTRVGMSGLGTMVATQNTSRTFNEFSWRYIPTARVRGTTDAGGQWTTFFNTFLRRFWRFKMYRNLNNDESSQSDIGLSSGCLGPYKMNPPDGAVQHVHEREISQHIERMHPISLDVVRVADY
jgi:hypothetical protein